MMEPKKQIEPEIKDQQFQENPVFGLLILEFKF